MNKYSFVFRNALLADLDKYLTHVLPLLSQLMREPMDAIYKGDVRLLATLNAVDVYGRRIHCSGTVQAVAVYFAFNLQHPRRCDSTMEVLEPSWASVAIGVLVPIQHSDRHGERQSEMPEG